MNKIVNISLLGSDNTLVVANYTVISENIRRLTPHGIQCSIFCGGSNCKYENPESWTADSLALQGIYSHWITDNILAMARPSTAVIIKKNIIQQFQSLGIKSIINLQCAKEHASCGEPLEESGFSYEPNVFMENDIYYYNFAWKDYGDATLSSLLSMIKVLAFATKEGRVAVHCHAGLGRTGVLIACYLVYSLRVTANDAIKYVRLRRPGSVQTRGQIICVRQFAQFILPKNITFFLKDSKDKYMTEFTLQRFLSRQKIVLHGYDERNFKFVPKIIHIICERILQLCGCHTDEFELNNMSITTDFLCSALHGNVNRNESLYNISSTFSEKTSSNSDLTSYHDSLSPISPNQSENDEPASLSQLSDSFSDLNNLDEEELQHELKERMLHENKCFQELQTQKTYEKTSIPENIYPVAEVIQALLADVKANDEDIKQSILRYKNEINTSQLGWLQLQSETNLIIPTILLFEWLECLKIPVLNKEKLETIVINYQQPENCFKKLGLEEGYLIEYLLNFITKLNPISPEDQKLLLVRIIAALAQQTVTLNDKQIPSGKTYRRLGEGTLNCTTKFLLQLMEIIQTLHLKSSTVN